jgi:hypothetical protein
MNEAFQAAAAAMAAARGTERVHLDAVWYGTRGTVDGSH